MAKPNYSHEKRKKELDRKRKHDEKQQRKQAKTDTSSEETADPDQNPPASVDTP